MNRRFPRWVLWLSAPLFALACAAPRPDAPAESEPSPRAAAAPSLFRSEVPALVFAVGPDGEWKAIGGTPGEVALPSPRREEVAVLARPRYPSIDKESLLGLLRDAMTANLDGLDIGSAHCLDRAVLEAIASAPGVRCLSIAGSTLSEDDLAPLSRMTSLERLWLWPGDVLGDRTVTSVAGLPRLRYLGIDGGLEVTDAAIRALSSARSLEWIDVSHTRMTRAGLAALVGLPSLRSIRARGCDLRSPESASTLAWPAGMACLDVRDTGLKLADFGATLPRDCLERLAISGDTLDDAGMRALARLERLTGLTLDRCSLPPMTSTGWGELATLRTLSLQRCELEPGGLNGLGALPRLECLRLSGTDLAVEDRSELARCRALEEIDISFSSDADRLVSNLQEATRLARIDLQYSDVSDAGILALASHHTLQRLLMAHCTSVTAPALKKAVRGLHLKELAAGGCPAVTDEVLDVIAKVGCMEELAIANCAGVSDGGIRALATMKSLKRLDVSGVDVSIETVEGLCNLPMMSEIRIMDCGRISPTEVRRLRLKWPRVTILGRP